MAGRTSRDDCLYGLPLRKVRQRELAGFEFASIKQCHEPSHGLRIPMGIRDFANSLSGLDETKPIAAGPMYLEPGGVFIWENFTASAGRRVSQAAGGCALLIDRCGGAN
jgi:hypothetical protein